MNQIFNKLDKIFGVVAIFVLLLFSFSVSANAQALPGENTPPEQNPTQVGLPKPNKSGSSSVGSSSQTGSEQITSPTTNPVTNQTVATPSTTVRSGGGSWLIFVFVFIVAYFGYNYWLNHQKKSTLKTNEKKLKL